MAVVIVHDYLTQRGGAERVVLEMARAFPGSVVVTSVYAPERTFPEFADLDIRATWMQRVPFLRSDTRRALPVLTETFRRQHLDAELVLVSSSGFAHTVGTSAPVVVYCHNPPRWVHQWDDVRPGLGAAERLAVRALRPYLRRTDLEGALGAARYMANSANVAQRIRRAYGRDAEVVHPPRGLEPYGPQEAVAGLPPRFLLTVGRPRGYKRTGLLTEAVAGMPDVHLVAVGAAPVPHPNVHCLRGVSDAQLRWLYANAAGLLACSIEDFGLTPVEAFGFGTPVGATREGGYLETCVAGRTGVWLDASSTAALQGSIRDLLDRSWDRRAIREHGERWTAPAFHKELHDVVDDVLSGRRARAAAGV